MEIIGEASNYISEEIKSKLMDRFKVNQWVVIEGDIDLNFDNENISFSFDYIDKNKNKRDNNISVIEKTQLYFV